MTPSIFDSTARARTRLEKEGHTVLSPPPSAGDVSKEHARRAMGMRGAVPDDLRKDVLREMHDQHAQDVAKALQEHDDEAVKRLHDDRKMMREYNDFAPQSKTFHNVRIPVQILDQEEHHLQLFKPRLQSFVKRLLPDVRPDDYEKRAYLEQRRIEELGDEIHRLDEVAKKELAEEAMKTQLARLAQQRYELFDGLPRAFRSATEEMSFEEENRKIVQLLTSHGGIEYCEEELHEWIKAEIALQCLRHPDRFAGMSHAEPGSYGEVKFAVRTAERIAEGIASSPEKLRATLCQSFFTNTAHQVAEGNLQNIQLAANSVTFVYFKTYNACQIARQFVRLHLPDEQLAATMRKYLRATVSELNDPPALPVQPVKAGEETLASLAPAGRAQITQSRDETRDLPSAAASVLQSCLERDIQDARAKALAAFPPVEPTDEEAERLADLVDTLVEGKLDAHKWVRLLIVQRCLLEPGEFRRELARVEPTGSVKSELKYYYKLFMDELRKTGNPLTAGENILRFLDEDEA
ncbi:uncharacterized protein RHTO_00302 [Rhodotorula toruloides NP11]|uniref:Uncharacterized protein n=1 Tax=Rhodotorula toruloides (strain NP11) TaxID=1130832 RepID=M7XPN2_RHOT1|nr:uncharacterized protein RHTO_00302 [Rhodotorula toruloides NP11]EMS25874.1 hypothetical protein RHTO_00302 [Rhodotorula toruloides NP11]